jgi:hypothetical protein
MKDVSKMRIAEIDALIAQSTMTEEQLAEYWQGQKVAAAFCRKHPEFKPTEKSGTLLDSYVKGMGWPVTLENVERAYENLKAEGAL